MDCVTETVHMLIYIDCVTDTTWICGWIHKLFQFQEYETRSAWILLKCFASSFSFLDALKDFLEV